MVTEKFIKKVHNDNLKVHVWTINQEDEMQKLIDMGVDGIMTDNAIGLMNVMKKNNLN